MEGVAFAARRNLRLMKTAGHPMDRLVASGGGAKTRLWLEIKASVYGCPIVVVNNAECGVVGCAILAGIANGTYANLEDAVARCVEVGPEVNPNPQWAETYQKLGALFDDLHETSHNSTIVSINCRSLLPSCSDTQPCPANKRSVRLAIRNTRVRCQKNRHSLIDLSDSACRGSWGRATSANEPLPNHPEVVRPR